MNDTKYNGWTNYATWRINLEIFDGFDPSDYYSNFEGDAYTLSESLKDYAEQVIFECSDVPDGLAKDYAYAFLSDVNWYEIAEHLIDAYKQEEEEEEEFTAIYSPRDRANHEAK